MKKLKNDVNDKKKDPMKKEDEKIFVLLKARFFQHSN